MSSLAKRSAVRRRSSFTMLLLLAAISLAGCGGYSGAPDNAEPDPGTNPGTGTPGTGTPGGGDPGGGSGGETPPGTPPGSGGGGTPSFDLSAGQSIYVNQCQSCHGRNGAGGLGPALTNTTSCPRCTTQQELSSHIAATMPSPGACVGDCAANVAAYILNRFSTVPPGGGTPTEPGTPTDPGTPPTDPTEPTDPGEPTDPSDPTTPTEPTGPGCTPTTPAPEPEPEPPSTVTPTCSVEASYASSWNTGFVFNVKLRNFSGAPVSGWKVTWTFPNDQRVTNSWNTQLSNSSQRYTALPASYNGTIGNDGTVEFGMQGTHGGTNELPTDLLFEAPGCVVASSGGGTPAPSEPEPLDDGGCSGEPLPGSEETSCDAPSAPRLQRLLNRWEYQRTIQDLVGISGSFADNLPQEARVAGYDNNARVALVTDRHVDEYFAAAEAVAERAVAERKSALLPCNPSSDKAACTRTFVRSFGKRAFRRTLSDAEVEQYAKLMSDTLTGGSFDSGMQLIVTAMLMSPNFLYRSEAGAAVDGEYRLSAFEAAASLSYLLWGSMPDDTLLDAADQLATAEGRAAQATRLLDDPRAKQQMGHFATEWLGTHYLVESFKDPELYPRLTPNVRQAMGEELTLFINGLVFGGGKFAELYTANYAYMNGPLRDYYRQSGSTTDANFTKQTVADGTRGGLLSLGAVMASHAHSNESSPIKRGVFVRERLLCQDLPDPPANVDTTPPGLDPSKTTRERFAQHTADPACASCHSFIDGIGFGLERYDGAGGYRDTENGQSVDDSGELKGPEGFQDATKKPFHGARELAALIAQTQSARDCMVLQYYRYGRGYVEDAERDQCTLTALKSKFAASDGDLKSLLLDYVRDDSFIRRRAE